MHSHMNSNQYNQFPQGQTNQLSWTLYPRGKPDYITNYKLAQIPKPILIFSRHFTRHNTSNSKFHFRFYKFHSAINCRNTLIPVTGIPTLPCLE